jgi:hypothetical protein
MWNGIVTLENKLAIYQKKEKKQACNYHTAQQLWSWAFIPEK